MARFVFLYDQRDFVIKIYSERIGNWKFGCRNNFKIANAPAFRCNYAANVHIFFPICHILSPQLCIFYLHKSIFNQVSAFIKTPVHVSSIGGKDQLTWFDGFKTLKYVDYIGDNGYLSMCYEEWNKHPFIDINFPSII